MTTIILLSLLGVIVSLVVGMFWYSPWTPMGRLHMKYVGFDKLSKEEQKEAIRKAKPTMWKSYLGQAVLSLFTSLFIVITMYVSYQNGAHLPVVTYVATWLAFMVPVVGSNIIWGNVDRKIAWKKFFADISCNLVTVIVIAFITSFFY